jgi:UDP-3-O-[3-hydroxymyristoyl] glucosamine N-acyltransferase
MGAYTLNELMTLTRAELFALHQRIVDAVAQLPDGSPERLTALANLRDIRRVLARCEFAPA